MALALRRFRSSEGNRYGIILGNYLTCMLLALLLTPRNQSILGGSSDTLLYGLVSGFFYVAGMVGIQTSVQRNGAGLTTAFAKLGLLVSLAVSILLFGERPAPLQFLGVLLVPAALVLIHSTPDQRGGRSDLRLLLLTLLFNGCADAMAKVYEDLGNPQESTLYFFRLFGTAFLLTLLLAAFERRKRGKRLRPQEFAAGFLVGIPNYFSSHFLLLALQKFPAFLVFPLFSTGTILLTLLAGWLLFREGLKRRQAVGVGLILAALVLLNLKL